MKRRDFLKKTSAASLLTLVTPLGITEIFSKQTNGSLDSGFLNPPMSAWPHTWWHWMNGNVTKEGITLDLEAMKRIGVGGFQNFDAGTLIPKGPIVYLSPEWIELKKHAIREADRLGLEFTMHNCPGWSSSGGPWITPELSMQQITFSEYHISGGRQVNAQLPQPASKLNYYKDAYVFAFPSLAGEANLQDQVSVVTENGNVIDLKKINGEDLSGLELMAEPGKPAYLEFEFKNAYAVRSLVVTSSIATQPAGSVSSSAGVSPGQVAQLFMLESSDDGKAFKPVASLIIPGARPTDSITVEFDSVTAKYFRLVSNQSRRFSLVRFSGAQRIPNWMAKANFTQGSENLNPAVDIEPESAINPDDVINLASNIDKDGNLSWNAPAGNWTIIRFGHTATGSLNKSAPDTGIGLECDKFSIAAIEFHFNKMMENLIPSLMTMAAKGKVGLLIDSYEVGMQNWTPLFPEEFKKRKGYDLLKYLPVLTGRIVGNLDSSDRFLWDFRRTNADIMADNYYGRFAELCKKYNFISYTEPYDRGPMEELQIGSRVDINMGEFWNGLSAQYQGNYTMRRTVKLASSIVHINGKKIVGAEAFTGEADSAKWQEYPFMMKTLGDKMYTQGLNRIIFHRYAHQPHPTALPGMTMGPWGIHFDRTNTWWESGKAWMKYLGRCQYILQQGLFVADLLYFTGENGAVFTKVHREELNPEPPVGYDYDLINAETLLKRAVIKNNRITLSDGMSYAVFVLQNYKTITLELLRKLKDMVAQGMILIGDKPVNTPGLVSFADNDSEFKQITRELWGNINSTSVTENIFGSGKVIWGSSVRTVLEQLSVKPDFEVSSLSGDAPIRYIHRSIDKTDVYFIANERRTAEELVCTFRVKDKEPELWDADTGKITPVKIYESTNGRVRLPVHLAPGGSVFVVFRKPALDTSLQNVAKDNKVLLTTKNFDQRQRRTFKDVVDNFTISLWAKPELNVMLAQRAGTTSPAPWTDNFAIYPPSGLALYGDGHETCGLTIGRNGVVVWTNGLGKPTLTMAAPVAISGWSHIALVVKENSPAIYVNGKLIQQGKSSGKILHPGLGEAYIHEGASYYNGDMNEPELFSEALNLDKIRQLSQNEFKAYLPKSQAVEIASAGKPALLFWEDGRYNLKNLKGTNRVVQVSSLGEPIQLTGEWQVSFPPDRGAPAKIKLSELRSLHTYSEVGVKYFSGTVTYVKNVNIPASFLSGGKRLFLDLGRVEVIAEVKINGKELGILWKRPYRVEITDFVRAGQNDVEISVTNLWPNRLIGDEQIAEMYDYQKDSSGAVIYNQGIIALPDWYRNGLIKPKDGRVTFTTWKHYVKDSPLLESGLIGPVTIKVALEHQI